MQVLERYQGGRVPHIPEAEGQRHVRIPNAGHFLQEDQGDLVAKELIAFIVENPR